MIVGNQAFMIRFSLQSRIINKTVLQNQAATINSPTNNNQLNAEPSDENGCAAQSFTSLIKPLPIAQSFFLLRFFQSAAGTGGKPAAHRAYRIRGV
jgi:hypothetical protein